VGQRRPSAAPKSPPPSPRAASLPAPSFPTGLKATYPVREGLKLLSISPTTGYAEIAAGRLKTFKIGRNRYISGWSLFEYIQSREAEARPVA
jgi:hypothetical protein